MDELVLRSHNSPFVRATARSEPVPGPVPVTCSDQGYAASIRSTSRSGGGHAAFIAKHPLPAILGMDLAGVVEDAEVRVHWLQTRR